MKSAPAITRKEFLLTVGGSALWTQSLPAQGQTGKLLIFVAHPDDEYAFAGATYHLVRELGWIADQITITGGESGNRYAALAEVYYGVGLSHGDAVSQLPAIRKEEARRAGKILGIREHHFLDQEDLGFDTDAAAADSSNWDLARIRGFLLEKLEQEHYDAIFTLLPTAETHGHHRAAALVALDVVSKLPEEARPLLFGVEPRSIDASPLTYSGLQEHPITRSAAPPAVVFDRCASFGYRGALNYQIVVHWVIAEHKSQGMFQNDYSKHTLEEFWLFEASGAVASARLPQFRSLLSSEAKGTTASN